MKKGIEISGKATVSKDEVATETTPLVGQKVSSRH